MIQAVIERCAGIDVGKKFLAVCVMTGPAKEDPQAELRKFGTVRAELVKLREWLKTEGCTHTVMESTGCYGKPVLNVLEDDPEYQLHVVLANPQLGESHHRSQDRSARCTLAGAFVAAWHGASELRGSAGFAGSAGFHPPPETDHRGRIGGAQPGTKAS